MVCNERDIWLSDTQNKIKKGPFKADGDDPSVAFPPGRQELIMSVTCDQTTELWDIEANTVLATFNPEDRILSAALLSDNQKAAIAAYETMRLREGDTILQTFAGHTDLIQSATMSPDGQRLATASEDKTIRLWNVESAALTRRSVTYPAGKVELIAFSPDCGVVATTSMDQDVTLWHIDTGTVLHTLEHSSDVYAIGFSPDGHHIATLIAYRMIWLWDWRTGVVLGSYGAGSAQLRHFDEYYNTGPLALRYAPNIQYDRQWILYNGKRVLWLPVTYQPYEYGVGGCNLVIGCYTGQILLPSFPLDPSLLI